MKATKRILAVIIGITTVFCCASCLNKNPSAPENRMQEVKPLADVEMSEKEAVQIVDGKRVLDFAKSIDGAGTKKTQFSLSDLETIIADCEKKYAENDVIRFDTARLPTDNLKDLYELGNFDSIQTSKTVNNIGTVSKNEYYDYLFEIYRMVIYEVIQTCDESIWMYVMDSEEGLKMNEILGQYTIRVISDMEGYSDRGIHTIEELYIFLWFQSEEEREAIIGDLFVFDVLNGNISYVSGTSSKRIETVFPTAEQQAALNAIIAREAAANPDK